MMDLMTGQGVLMMIRKSQIKKERKVTTIKMETGLTLLMRKKRK